MGKPKISGQSMAVEVHATTKIVLPGERLATRSRSSHEWRNVEQQPIGDNSDPRIAPNSNESSSRQQAQQEDGRSSGNVVPVEGPDVTNGDSVGKHRAVAIELKLVEKRDLQRMQRDQPGPTPMIKTGANAHRDAARGRTCQRLSAQGAIQLNANGDMQVQDFSPADAFIVPNLCPERTAFVVR